VILNGNQGSGDVFQVFPSFIADAAQAGVDEGNTLTILSDIF
jgi:hypothetical protein